MSKPVEREVLELVARFSGWPVERLRPDMRLFDDLGLDGDDAVELVAAFEQRYGADLAPLWRHWRRHFGPEGWPLWPGLVLVGGVIVVTLASVLLKPLGVHPAFVVAAAMAALAGGVALWRRNARPMQPIAIDDLIAAARSGRWPTGYED